MSLPLMFNSLDVLNFITDGLLWSPMKIVGCSLKGKIHHNLKEDIILCVLLETGSQPWVMSNSLCSQSLP